MKNIKDIIKKLYSYYNVSSVIDLSKKMGVKKSTFYMWVSKKSVNSLKRKIREINIHKEIFDDDDVVLKNANDFIDRLMEFYEISTFSELTQYIKVSQPTISRWVKNNSIDKIKKRCRELGIYNDIFGFLKEDKNMNNIVINDFLLEQAKEKASKFGLNLNEYLEVLIIEDLK